MDNDERLIKLETEMQYLKEYLKDQQEATKAVLAELQSIRSDLSRYKGFWGGIVLVVSTLGALIELGLHKLLN